MAKSDAFRSQHKELLDIVGKLQPLVPQAATKAADIRNLLTLLGGKVTMHLQMEDTVLYKAMLANAATKPTAEKFQKEMGGIKDAFVGFLNKYATPAAIQGNPAGFAADIGGIVKALGGRIQREESELYPAFDKI
jgi:hypothetical protein